MSRKDITDALKARQIERDLRHETDYERALQARCDALAACLDKALSVLWLAAYTHVEKEAFVEEARALLAALKKETI
jgi:hypothetical protein